jgi:type I restriction enzyme S subunit
LSSSGRTGRFHPGSYAPPVTRRAAESGRSLGFSFLFLLDFLLVVPDVERNLGKKNQKIQDSELRPIPNGWEVRSLYQTARFINGAVFKSADFCSAAEGLPVIKIAELKDGVGAQTKFSKRELGADQRVDAGDLLYSWSGSPDTSLDAFIWGGRNGLLNQHFFKVVTPNMSQRRFVYYLLKYLRSELIEIARNKQTTGLGHVTVADMKRLPVRYPPETVLAAFDSIVAPLYDRSFANELESRTLADLRDTLLPKLLSGELRLPQIDASQV